MMTEQGRVLSALLQGAFICQVTMKKRGVF